MALPPILLPPCTLVSMLMMVSPPTPSPPSMKVSTPTTALPPTRSAPCTPGSTPTTVWLLTLSTPSTTLMGARRSKADSQAPTNLFYLFHGIQSMGQICIEIDLQN